MKIDVLTLFPDIFPGPLGSSVDGRALRSGVVEFNAVNIRDFAKDERGTVDERPYGGGNATGVKIDPIGFLVIKEGTVRMINVTPPASNTVDRIIDMVPQVMDRVDAFITKQKQPK